MPDSPKILASRLSRLAAPANALRHIRSLVILGGAVRPSPLLQSIGRSPFDLPLGDGTRLLDRWIAQAAQLVEARDLGSLTLQLMLDAKSPAPLPRPHHRTVQVTIERDPFEYRGTGGVLHDVARDLDDDHRLLVASGAQLPIIPLIEVATLLATGDDVTTLSHTDGTPSTLMLLRCGALRGISDIGFVDLKEQTLPVLARTHAVSVHDAPPVSLPIRTARDYLAALRVEYRQRRGAPLQEGPFVEDWQAEFSLAERGASVHETARLFDSVVLDGASVGAEAVLVRTIVCPGAHVKAGKRLVDSLVTADQIIQHTGVA